MTLSQYDKTVYINHLTVKQSEMQYYSAVQNKHFKHIDRSGLTLLMIFSYINVAAVSLIYYSCETTNL